MATVWKVWRHIRNPSVNWRICTSRTFLQNLIPIWFEMPETVTPTRRTIWVVTWDQFLIQKLQWMSLTYAIAKFHCLQFMKLTYLRFFWNVSSFTFQRTYLHCKWNCCRQRQGDHSHAKRGKVGEIPKWSGKSRGKWKKSGEVKSGVFFQALNTCTRKLVFRPGLCPGPHWGAYDALPDPLVGWGGGHPIPFPSCYNPNS